MTFRSIIPIRIPIAISILFVCISLNYSFEYHKLSTVIGYDDIVYFNDGLTRLRIFYEKGVLEFLADLCKNPPHSPFSTLLATTAFAIFGVRDWAPYVANIVILFALLLATRHIARPMSFGAQMVIFLFVLAPNFVTATVTEFRPDLPAGLFGAIAVFFAATKKISDTSFRDRFYLGAMFALAMLTKPTASIFVVVMMVASLGFAVYRDYTMKNAPKLTSVFLLAVQCLIIAIILVLPYYYLNWDHLTRYVSSATGSDVWVYSKDWGVKFWMYLTGVYGSELLGFYLYIYAVMIMLFGGILIAGKKMEIVKVLGGLIMLTVMAWFAPTSLGMGNPFFAATFYYLFLFAALYAFVNAFALIKEYAGGRFYRFESGVVVIFFTLALGYVAVKNPSVRARPIYSNDSLMVSREIFDILEGDVAASKRQSVNIYYTATGYINNDLFSYMFNKKNNKTRLTGLFDFGTDEDEWLRLINMSSYIVASEPGTGGVVNEGFPSGKLLDKSMALVRSRKEFVEIKSVKLSTGANYYLFKRIGDPGAVKTQ